MMSSRVLSRLLPGAEGDEQVSVYGGLRRQPPWAAHQPDLESQHARPLAEQFHDDDDDPEALLYDAQHHADGANSNTASPEATGKGRDEHDEDDVPESLLLEDKGKTAQQERSRVLPGKQAHTASAQWHAAQEQHVLHPSQHRHMKRRTSTVSKRERAAPTVPASQSDPRAHAMWLYTNATNLDAFLLEVYQYYAAHGVWSILLQRILALITELFVFSFAMFLTTCIDYSKIPGSKSTGEVLIPKCMAKATWMKNAALFFFIVYWLSQLTRHIADTRRLLQMHDFFTYVLEISDQDIQTVSWVRVVDGLVKISNANVATADQPQRAKKFLAYNRPQQRLNAETIANRLMRQTNYYVALYNKDILDFTLPLPFLGHRHFYSKSLEWCIDFCLTNFVFDEQGNIRPFCLDVKNRRVLVQALQTRLKFAALTSIVIAPFNILRFCIIYFFRYYTEFTRNPARVSARSFTPFAEWKIRQVNELDHLFQRRLRLAYPCANEYLKQFPKDKMDQVCRFVAFVSGAIAAVLAIATLLDPELFLGFEVTPGRTAVFWLTIMVGIFGVAHGSLPDENEVYHPVQNLKEVLQITGYIPAHWEHRLHSNEVRAEFSAMYQMKILIFVEEILSLIVAPWILVRNANARSERIVDFFREHTVHVEGIGHQCNFAVFNFKKDPNVVDPTTILNEADGLRDDYYGLKDDKMAASVQNFVQYYSHPHHRQGGRRSQGWQPPPAWPSILSSPVIAEEEGFAPHGHKPSMGVAASRPRRSGNLDKRRGPVQTSEPSSAIDSRRPRGQRTRIEAGEHVMSPNSLRPKHNISESVMMRHDSDLHDYIEGPTSREKLPSDSEAEDTTGDDMPGGNAGVLGMLYQFSKAQTERGTGVNI